MILHVIIENKVAVYQKRDGDIVCANSGYQIQFTFDSEWDAYPEKTARFKWNGSFIDVPFTGDTCDVPEIDNALECEVGVYAGDLCTTTPAVIGCKKSILCGAATPSPENDRRYANEAKEAAERAEAVADRIPYIKNGTWWIGDVDTGASAQGADGAAGKSVHIFTTDYENSTEALRAIAEASETCSFKVNESTAKAYDGDICLIRCTDTTKGCYAYILGESEIIEGEDVGIYPMGIIESGANGATGENGKSAYDYAVEGGYTGTEAEFAAKLAAEMPDKLPNPNALTFTGAVTGSYDGSAPLSIEIPDAGLGVSGEEKKWRLIGSVTTEEAVNSAYITIPDDILEVILYAKQTGGAETTAAFCVFAWSNGQSGNVFYAGSVATTTNNQRCVSRIRKIQMEGVTMVDLISSCASAASASLSSNNVYAGNALLPSTGQKAGFRMSATASTLPIGFSFDVYGR